MLCWKYKLLLHWVISYITTRYLTYVMDVATPTEDCLTLVHDLLLPVIMKSKGNSSLSHQEVWANLTPNSYFVVCF
jgi:hypothetical protein